MPTDSERYLAQLCRRSFLSLWSWPHLYRDQKWGSGTEGKEICDLIVIFPPHVIMFSDKYAQFPSGVPLQHAWCRWYRRAIRPAAEQLAGAQRWLTIHPQRIFVDSGCSTKLPIRFPESPRFHRIIVAHGAAESCHATLGGSGSLMLGSKLSGDSHQDPSDPFFSPFLIGNVKPELGYIHVLDDTSLDIILNTLDTVPDFVRYLERKENAIARGALGLAAGEEELLAVYLRSIGSDGQHDFPFPSGRMAAVVEGGWQYFKEHPERTAQEKADRVSYTWDQLIETFSYYAMRGELRFNTGQSLSDFEEGVRLLASESRVSRRLLASSFLGTLRQGNYRARAARVASSDSSTDTCYIFVSLDRSAASSLAEYRELRVNILYGYVLATKLLYPAATSVVGIASEPAKTGNHRSEDMIHLPHKEWTPEFQARAREIRAENNILMDVRQREHTVSEYPLKDTAKMHKGRSRNCGCPCGSGLKYKRCCGSRSRALSTLSSRDPD